MPNKKKIILIVPYFNSGKARKWNEGVEDDKDFECYPPLGLMYLAGSINRLNNYEVRILDVAANRWSLGQLKEVVYKEAPDIVGITVTSPVLNTAYNIIKDILLPMVPRPLIIVGGPHITSRPEDIEVLGADYGFVGDAENSLHSFLKDYLGNKDSYSAPGLVSIKDGKVFVNPRPCDDRIDDMPLPDRSSVDPKLYYFSIIDCQYTLMLTSRGCPFDCIYCGVPNKGRYMCRQIPDVIDEMKGIKSQGYKYINICDDVFTLDRKRTVDLCQEIIGEHINIKWGCATRVDLLDPELLKIMKKAGCLDVRLGVETGCEKTRRQILGKNISNRHYEEGIRNIKMAGLLAVGFFLIGVPGETKKDIDQTVRFACSLPLDYASFNLVVPLPGSRLYKTALQEGKISQGIWKEVARGNLKLPSYVPDGLDSEYLEKASRRAMRMFYMRPGYLFYQLSQISSIKDFAHKVKTAKSLLQ